MDTATKNLLARVFASLAFAALLLHVGQHVGRLDPVPPLAWLAVAGFLVASVAAAWAQARLNAKRAALWTALATCGALPIGAWLLHRASPAEPGGYGIVLLLALLFGALASLFLGWRLAERA